VRACVRVCSWFNEALFSTLTNVNFSAERIHDYIMQAQDQKESIRCVATACVRVCRCCQSSTRSSS
jgi:hydroxylamine reductase (hybrid-cluster protein)